MQRTAPVADRLWREHGDDLVRYATALVGPDDALDVVAETFVRIVAMRPDQLDAIRDARSYLHRMVLNDARMMRRSESRRDSREWRATTGRPDTEWIDIDAIRPMLMGLSVRQRAAVFLTYWHDLPPDDVARLMGTGTGSVKRHLARAREHLRRHLT